MLPHVSALLAAAVVLRPNLIQAPVLRRGAVIAMQTSLSANDGGDEEIDWDKEAAALAKPANKFFKEIKDIPVPELVSEFARTAPKPVQHAMRVTIAQLLGNMPEPVAQSSLTTTGQNIASLMMSMQMTGYMFRNAEYRRSLASSLEGADSAEAALPPVKGTIGVKLGEGMVTEVDAASYMAELRSEVEGLRGELMAIKEQRAADPAALITYMQSLSPDDAKDLTSTVSSDVLEAMQQLIASILKEINVAADTVTEVPNVNLKEMLIWQLVSGYKLRELEVKDELKDKFWGA